MIRDLNKDMFENTVIKSMSGATVSDVFHELKKQDDVASFKDIILHSMEACITLLMVRAPNARVFISAVCPRSKGLVDHKVNTINTAFKDLAFRLGCVFIDAGSYIVHGLQKC